MCVFLEATAVQDQRGVILRPRQDELAPVTTDEYAEPMIAPWAEPAYFADMALDLHDEPTAARTIDRIAEFAKAGMRSDDAGILLVHTRRRIETAAATSKRAERAHELQTELDEGPCLDALSGKESYYLIGDAATDTRWPQWGRIVAEAGIRSALSIRLETRARSYGSLNLYGSKPEMFGPDDLAVASIFARHASIALASSQETDGLQRAMDARKVIGIAMGILMERYAIEPDRAFDVLQRYSQTNNIKLREVAQQVADRRALPSD
jgi:GAF domain-containing protein